MPENSFQNLVAVKRLPDPLVVQLRIFTTALIEQGYADETVRLKLQLLTNFGQWLRRKNLAVTNLDERFVDAFLKRKRRVHRGNLKTLQQFLDHLRKRDVIPARNLPRDRSPLADILSGTKSIWPESAGWSPTRHQLPVFHSSVSRRALPRKTFPSQNSETFRYFKFCFAA